MAEDIPEHRAAVTLRSGDTHVIGTPDGVEDHAEAVNIDQAARDAAAAGAPAPVLGSDGPALDPPAGDPGDPPAKIVAGKRPALDLTDEAAAEGGSAV